MNIEQTLKSTREMSTYWQNCADSIRRFENSHQGKESAIYGSGFYGSYIFSQLKEAGLVKCFLDQKPIPAKWSPPGKNQFFRQRSSQRMQMWFMSA